MSADSSSHKVGLDEKSDRSMRAGQALISQGYFTQSVHCFYYSVLQMMKYKLAHCSVDRKTYEEQESLIIRNNKSTHDWLFAEIPPRLNRKSKVVFVEDFRSLKSSRKEADYSDHDFTLEESLDCRHTAERLLSRLRDIR